MPRLTRREVWKHNSYFGHVAMSKRQMENIISSDTATPAAKRVASAIIVKLDDLHGLLKERTK